MKVLLFADGYVGYSIAKHLIQNYRLDLQCVVTIEHNDISILSESAKINTLVYKDDLTLVEKLAGSELGLLVWWPLVIKYPPLCDRYARVGLLIHNRVCCQTIVVSIQTFGQSSKNVVSGAVYATLNLRLTLAI